MPVGCHLKRVTVQRSLVIVIMSALFLLFCLVGGAWGRRYYGSLTEDCIPAADYDPSFVFFPESFQVRGDVDSRVRRDGGVVVEVADDFRVRYGSNFKVVDNLRVNETYVLYQCGTTPPEISDGPSIKLFEIPLSSVALPDVTASSFLTELGVADRVKYASNFATDACLQKLTHKCGKIAETPGSPFADENGLRMQNRRSDGIFVFSATNHSKTIAFTATADPAVLKRAEWVKFVSLFFNKEREANLFFDEVKESWEKFNMHEGKKKKENSEGPLVAWISFQDYDGKEFFIHAAPYKVEYIKAAGGRVLDVPSIEKRKGVTPTTNGVLIEFNKRNTTALELLHDILSDVDIVIDETYQQNNTAYDIASFYAQYGMTSSKSEKGNKGFKFVKRNKVFRLDGTIGKNPMGTDSMDWYETGVARPDLVLKDFQVAFGTQKHKRHERIWLRNLSEGEVPRVIHHKQCKTFASCNARPSVICPSVQVTCLGEIEYRTGTECQPIICN